MKQLYILRDESIKRNAAKAILSANIGMVVEIRDNTRSSAQSNHLWAVLTDISKQVLWPVNEVAQYISPEDWKKILLHSTSTQKRMVPGICGVDVPGLRGGVLLLDEKISTRQLIRLAYEFGDSKHVVWSYRRNGDAND